MRKNTLLNQQLRRQGLDLYLTGLPMTDIADKLGVAYPTLYKWCQKYDWEALKEEVDRRIANKAITHATESVSERRERILKIMKNIQAKGYKEVMELPGKISVGDVIRAAELEGKLTGMEPPTQIQAEIREITPQRAVELVMEAKRREDRKKTQQA